MRISIFKHQTVTFARVDTKRYIKIFKYKLRNCNADVKEALTSSYGQSILRYLATPLLGAKIINDGDILSLEASLFRESHSLPNSVSNKSILSVAQRMRPTLEVCKS